MADLDMVLKGLECCSDVGGKHCYEGKCPYASVPDPCREQLAKDAIELLKALKTENQIFSDNIKELTKQRDAFAMTIDELRYENKRLKAQLVSR